MTKYLIFDSGSLINFTSNSLLSVFDELKDIFPGEFIIPPAVKTETIDYPLKVKRFEWGALRVKQLLEKGSIKLSSEGIVDVNELKKASQRILGDANNAFFSGNKPLHIIDDGEAECLALSKILTEQGHECIMVIDERTARVLVERPENLQKLLTKKLHRNIKADKTMYKMFQGFSVIRSTELAYIAYKKGFIEIKDKKTLEAVTYALKYGGVSISEKEVEMYMKMK